MCLSPGTTVCFMLGPGVGSWGLGRADAPGAGLAAPTESGPRDQVPYLPLFLKMGSLKTVSVCPSANGCTELWGETWDELGAEGLAAPGTPAGRGREVPNPPGPQADFHEQTGKLSPPSVPRGPSWAPLPTASTHGQASGSFPEGHGLIRPGLAVMGAGGRAHPCQLPAT